MSTSFGRHYTAIPGPSVIPDRVLRAMHRPAPNIYDIALENDYEGICRDLKAIARTKGHVVTYIANGHGVWEATVSNMFSRGDRILVLNAGWFAYWWGKFAESMGVEADYLEFGMSDAVDPEAVHHHLCQDQNHGIRAVLVVQVDTASSVRNDIPAIRKAIDQAEHPALLAVDCIASLGIEEFDMDGWGVDVMVAGSQKGLMAPPGLAFVFCNEKTLERCRNADLKTPYWNWDRRINPESFYLNFCGTAPTHHLFALKESLNMILREEGLQQTLHRHALLASAIWEAIETWGTDGPLTANIRDRALRSHAVTSVRADRPFGKQLREWLDSHAGVTLGIGLGMESPDDPHSDGSFRIGHMGHINTHMVLGALGAIESALCDLGIPHGKGALEAAASVCAAASTAVQARG